MNHLDLFSGIGGFSLAASWVWKEEHNIVSFVEIDKFCQKVLNKHWPDVPIHDDIRSYKNNGTTIDLLTGGFPCQPFSCAGKQGGERDDRYLWSEMLRIISEVRPTWIIGENVAGIINLALDQVLSDLENEGYACQPFIIPACAKDAPHRRDRVWIVANAINCANRTNGGTKGKENSISQKYRTEGCSGMSCGTSGSSKTMGDTGLLRQAQHEKQATGIEQSSQDVADTKRNQPPEPSRTRSGRTGFNNSGMPAAKRNRSDNWLPEPNVGRVAHGIPRRVDRLKSLGNAIVPQVVVPIMEAIKKLGGLK